MLPDKDAYKIQLMEGFQKELDQWRSVLSKSQVASIYFGGGTPALLGANSIQQILSWIKNITSLSPGIEITLEANPENITLPLMQSYAEVGINRVSIGVQSLDDSLLATLGRTHSANKAIDAVHDTVKSNIHNVTIDLMYDLPGQDLTTWNNTLKQVVQLPITHLSLYNLTLEPNTAFFKRKKEISNLMPEDEISLQMYELAIEMLEKNNLIQYEISAFAKNNLRSHHNVGYWTARPFIGFGPSAFSYWEGKRFRNVPNLSQYCKKLTDGLSPIDFTEKLDPLSARRESLAIHLRLIEGVSLSEFERLHGTLDPETKTVLIELETCGFITQNRDSIKLTRKGLLFYDTVAADII